MNYPHRPVRIGERDAALVRALKHRLNEALGLHGAAALDIGDPAFGPRMRNAVRLFQERHVDTQGRPLVQDGNVGVLTWAALFGAASVAPRTPSMPPLLARAVQIAGVAADRGVREMPRNSNRGPEVDEYLRRTGTPPGHAWCCAFVYWCMDEAASALGIDNPMVRTAGCLKHWQRAEAHGATRLLARDARRDVSLVQPGMMFIIDHRKGLGHTGLIERVEAGLLHTIEGNTDASRTREGGGVYRLVRKVGEINRGFIAYRARAALGSLCVSDGARGVDRLQAAPMQCLPQT
ncbi:MAG: hypothetical protein AVDCRST_MAG71-880 [uncultured Lysobacter sp.]|uniref:Peptidase C51 domain-containing protein n=1 Tax=uncultured Lysobacter sp. TaxID=271060 RepID=A0A6J4KXG9_9GAMM|nr:MAG: hypothetical protein AVDCRST_MAG71-880 [uncultured Lysobacter sp.]